MSAQSTQTFSLFRNHFANILDSQKHYKSTLDFGYKAGDSKEHKLLPPSLRIERVNSAVECEEQNYPELGFNEYTFNVETCTCFYDDGIPLPPDYCRAYTPRVNPLAGPTCITQEDYDRIFENDHDCGAGASDDTVSSDSESNE